MQNSNDAMQEAMRLAKTPAGQQLLQMLQQANAAELQQAMSSAAAGDYTQAKKTLSALLDTPEARKLLNQLGGNHG